MEKTEGRKQGSSPGSSSRRTYSLFSSIINLSSAPGVKTTDGSSSQQSPYTIPITSANHHQKLPPDAPKKKKGRQPSSPNQSLGSPRTGGVNGLIGPAPRTLSILTALNELAISDRTGVLESNGIPRGGRADPNNLVIGGGALKSNSNKSDPEVNSHYIYRNLPSTANNNTSAPVHHHSHHASPKQLNRDDLPSPAPSSLGFSSMPRKLKGLDRKSRKSSASPSGGSSHTTHRSKSKERTPDWIWRIFQLAKHGRLQELQQSLKGLEPLDPTLIRHLVDRKGNTLLHCAARGGHVLTLQWLVSILGPHTEAVLNDKNRAGRNVILTALKGGQLKCFQWLVLQSISGDKALVPKDRERSLLHFAASYGNDAAVQWLVEQLRIRNVPVDHRDSGGMTPLHMAGRAGSVSVCHTLIAFAGADPFSQTELGWRASDLALRHRHMSCANYLLMAEAASSLGNELYTLHTVYRKLEEENESLRHHFKEVLRVGKSLVKERVDLIKSFPPAGSKSSPEAELLLGGTSCNGARLSGLEHKLVRAEQAWKRIEQSERDKLPMTSPSSPMMSLMLPAVSSSASPASTGGVGTAKAAAASPMSSSSCSTSGTATNSATPTPTSSTTMGARETETSSSPLLDADFTVQNINSPNLLQKRLAGLQSRHDKHFNSEALLSASSSDAESTASEESSSNDDQKYQNRHHNHHERPPPHHHHHHQEQQQNFHRPVMRGISSSTSQLFNPSNKGNAPGAVTGAGPAVGPSAASTAAEATTATTTTAAAKAPWLLPPDDALLSALSPIVNQMETTGTTSISTHEFIPSLDLIRMGPSTTNILYSPETFGKTPTTPPNSSNNNNNINSLSKSQSLEMCGIKTEDSSSGNVLEETPSATVIEVIEPPNKSVYFTPDLIRGTRHKQSYNIKSNEPIWTTNAAPASAPTSMNATAASPNRSTGSIKDNRSEEDIQGQVMFISEDPTSCTKLRQASGFLGAKESGGVGAAVSSFSSCYSSSSSSSTSSSSSSTSTSTTSASLTSNPSCLTSGIKIANCSPSSSWHRSGGVMVAHRMSNLTPTKTAPNNPSRNSPRLSSQSNPFLLQNSPSCDPNTTTTTTTTAAATAIQRHIDSPSNSSGSARRSVAVAFKRENIVSTTITTTSVESTDPISSPSSFTKSLSGVGVGATSISGELRLLSPPPTFGSLKNSSSPQPFSTCSSASNKSIEIFRGNSSSFSLPDEDNDELDEEQPEHHGDDDDDDDDVGNPVETEIPTIPPPVSSIHIVETISTYPNPSLIKRSSSSVSRISATIEIPFRHKSSWSFNEQLTNSEAGYLGVGRVSPNPSESSRTESAFMPPSHTSQNSELSKTESVCEPSLPLNNLDDDAGANEAGQQARRNDVQLLPERELRRQTDAIIDSPILSTSPPTTNFKMTNNSSSFPSVVGDSKTQGASPDMPTPSAVDHQGGSSALMVSGNVVRMPSTAAKGGGNSHPEYDMEAGSSSARVKSSQGDSSRTKKNRASSSTSGNIIRSRGASAIHKGSLQRGTKSSRGPPKPWYEIEGSDEESSHLLRVARSSRSSCLSTPSFSTDSEDDSESNNNNNEVQQPQPTASSSHHHRSRSNNCPEFV